MAITGSGQVSLGDIQTEFGGSNPIGLSEYYGEGNAPGSGEIQLAADFYGTSSITDAHTLIASATISNDASITFSSGIDSTYDLYEFRFSIHPASNATMFGWQANAAGGSSFNETITQGQFRSRKYEFGTHHGSATDAKIEGEGTGYYNNETTYIRMNRSIGVDNDHSSAGTLHIYRPSNTASVTVYHSKVLSSNHDQAADIHYSHGYINNAAAIDEVDFKMEAGNLQTGTIKLYGLSLA